MTLLFARFMNNESRILTLLPPSYHDERLKSWELNAHLWAQYVDSDSLRAEMVWQVAQTICSLAREANSEPIIVDFGCGEGALLRLCHQQVPSAKLIGIDYCHSMLAQAKQRSHLIPINFVYGDIEEKMSLPTTNADLAVTMLALDEVESLEQPFSNIAAALRPGGVAVAVILDPAVELIRHPTAIALCSNGEMPGKLEALLIVKHFRIGEKVSPAPYHRIIRPRRDFFGSAYRQRLYPMGVEMLRPGSRYIGPDVRPGFSAMLFRKMSDS